MNAQRHAAELEKIRSNTSKHYARCFTSLLEAERRLYAAASALDRAIGELKELASIEGEHGEW